MTNITGALSILQGCKKLSILLIAKNFYDEMIPTNVNFLGTDGFPNLQVFGTGGSRLKGEIPAWLIKLKIIKVMDLSENRLVGLIPGWLGTLSNLVYFDLSDNLLTGEFPKELFQLRALMSQKEYDAIEWPYLELPIFIKNVTIKHQYNQLSSFPPAIYIRENKLTGSIPVEVGQLKVLHSIEFSQNNLSGSIPDELSNLKRLEIVDLSNNSLSGGIPWSLRGLHFLSYFNVANNTLSGPIPTGGQFDTFPKAYFEGNSLLCGGVLLTSCTAPASSPTSPSATEMDEGVKRPFVLGIVTGFVVSFGLILVLLR